MENRIQTGSADIEIYGDHVLKIIDLELQRPPHDALKELKLLKMLSHKNVVRLLSSEIKPASITLVMPRYTSDLDHFMDKHWKIKYNPYLLNDDTKSYKNTLSFSDSICILKQLTEALEYIHSNGIIHRDIKPHNILLNSAEDLVLGDFGISYNGDLNSESKTCDCSTSIYKAPELLFSVANYKFEIDIWSLAILFSQLWNDKTSNKSCTSKVIDIDIEECSDIRLVLTIFSNFGKPSSQDWPQVSENESFKCMFGHLSSDDFIHILPQDEKLSKVYQWMPLIENQPRWASLWLKMVLFNGEQRITASDLLKLIY